MAIRLTFFMCFIILSCLFADREAYPQGEHRAGREQAIEDYEKEKLAKFKQNIGRRLLAVRTINPAVFYESPDDLERKLNIRREKEGFLIMEVVQNQLGTMNFYQVKFDTGQTGYLSADGNYLQIKIKEGSLISVSRRGSAKKKDLSQSKGLASQAVELVKNHLTLANPVTGAKRSVEKRMMDQKMSSFPNLKWRYEAKEIGNNKHRVTQYAGEGAGPPLIRTWIVDLSTREVKPENLAAKELYRPFN
ncbi:MAG: hypothetical protein KGZ49_06665 [Syntrophaceae bacterium]|nr:hypothetical protein [Syntrophaceae bacterium]